MKWLMRNTSVVGTVVLVSALLFSIALAQHAPEGVEDDWPLRDVRVPLELFETGAVRAEICAAAARLPVEGVTEAKGVILTLYRPDGEAEGVMHAEHCYYNQAARTVTSDSRVRFQNGDRELTGLGFEWRADEEKLWIRQNVRAQFTGMALPVLPEVGHE